MSLRSHNCSWKLEIVSQTNQEESRCLKTTCDLARNYFLSIYRSFQFSLLSETSEISKRFHRRISDDKMKRSSRERFSGCNQCEQHQVEEHNTIENMQMNLIDRQRDVNGRETDF